MTLAVEFQSLLNTLSASGQSLPTGSVAKHLGERFDALMQRNSAPPSLSSDEGVQTVSKEVLAQDQELQRTVSDTLALTRAAPAMSMQELSAAGMQMSLEIAGMQMDMQAKMAVVDSSKSALETLMRQE